MADNSNEFSVSRDIVFAFWVELLILYAIAVLLPLAIRHIDGRLRTVESKAGFVEPVGK